VSTLFSDPVLASYPYEVDADLHLCPSEGVAYQHTLGDLVEYDEAYFDKYVGYEDTPVARRLNAFRRDFAQAYGPGPAVLDVGVGSLEFLKSIGWRKAYGTDVNPKAIQALQDRAMYVDLEHEKLPADVGVVTLWDVFEHLAKPSVFLKKIPAGVKVCLSLPIFTHLNEIRESKHYRPGEHLTYWTDPGVRRFFDQSGFHLEATSREESEIGRDSIGSYRFQKKTPMPKPKPKPKPKSVERKTEDIIIIEDQ
jgi:hypothetical protein